MLKEKISWLRLSQKRFPPVASDQAGSQGEQLALRELQKLKPSLHGPAEIYRALRVPKAQGNGKFEIDLLLVSETGILVIEVKHWGGRLSRQKGKWRQERGQEVKALIDPVPLNADKLESLRIWLGRRQIALPRESLHSLVLLTNPQVKLDPELKASETVVELSNLSALALLRCGQSKRPFWRKAPPRAYDFQRLVATLDELPTWDRLQLHGGHVILGDLEYMAVPGVKASGLQRKYLRQAKARITRRIFPGIFLTPKLVIQDWLGKKSVLPLHPESKLVFRPAGQNTKEEYSWLHVESLQLGWKDQSYYASTQNFTASDAP